MAKYLFKRLLHGLISILIVVAIVMILIYSLMDRTLIFAKDAVYSKQANNQKVTYRYQQWEKFGYLDYVTYADWINELFEKGEIDADTRDAVIKVAQKQKNDKGQVAEYVQKFTQYYESQGYEVTRLDAVMQGKKKYANGGQQALFATKDKPLIGRLWNYLKNLVTVDNIHYVEEDIGDRGLTFTWHDPVYGGEKFAPAIIGNGTMHKYLLYIDNKFPFIHQNLITISLGVSYSVNMNVDVFDTMTKSQGAYVQQDVIYPTGIEEFTADDLHSATYMPGSRTATALNERYYVDDYTNVTTFKSGRSKLGYSFIIGIIATALAYFIGIPVGIVMARRKDKLFDHIGTVYIVFIIAVPSLAYIFLVKAIGYSTGLPTTFDLQSTSKLMYLLPIISLSLPSIASLMRWLRRYMIDQMNSDYVKFARSGGLSENEIFTKHVLKNAIIPIVHGVPASILFAMTGAIITERAYVVPGAGNLLTEAISAYDNSVIVGVVLFYAVLSVVSVILGDILMSIVDPRISFTSKAR